MLLFIVDNVEEVLKVCSGVAGGDKLCFTEHADGLLIENILEMLQGQGILKDVQIGDGSSTFDWGAESGSGEQREGCGDGRELHCEDGAGRMGFVSDAVGMDIWRWMFFVEEKKQWLGRKCLYLSIQRGDAWCSLLPGALADEPCLGEARGVEVRKCSSWRQAERQAERQERVGIRLQTAKDG